ncbi:MAG: transglycosylase SLT domain-containing protein [Synechococcaceae cyanobacterium]|nr:transglycosylase SLT domain-containing protein [Synechococcaceae cyanobacterium]
MARLPLLLAVSCLGSGAALLAGGALLQHRPPLTPATPSATLARMLRWSPDPARRREAALLLAARVPADGDREESRRLLRGQGWGVDPLAAVVLKRDAQAAQALGREERASEVWSVLARRFPDLPASADALYALGRRRPELRGQLMGRFPAHPAALAAALEAGPGAEARRSGALHLARWGARWPGAHERLRELCRPADSRLAPGQRAQLAGGLAELGDADAALTCLGIAPEAAAADPLPASPALAALSPAGRLALARALLRGGTDRSRLAATLLVQATRPDPEAPEAEEAVRLLALQEGPGAAAALQDLPERWRRSAPVAAHRVRARLRPAGQEGKEASGAPDAATLRAGGEVLRRWPGDPASWDLQWDLARLELLAGRWSQADALLGAIEADRQPPPLAARHRFWQGYVQQRLGRHEAATASWRRLRLHHPGGYYGWRAARQLGEGDLRLSPGSPGSGPAAPAASPWQPLASGDGHLDRLWRLDQRTEAWESWRNRRGGRSPRQSAELLVEGRLRQGVGDDWTGFDQLEQAALRLPPERCDLLPQLEISLHPLRYQEVFAAVARRRRLPIELLLAIAKQESRFSPGVRSPAGAVGLMQVLPATAAEVAGGAVTAADLEDPARNADLGAAYLARMLQRWQGDPLLATASYNAGPGAVEGWVGPLLRTSPELWVEAIPYPETRFYVKKVLGNAWSYQEARPPRC